jgi:hypothetical protein
MKKKTIIIITQLDGTATQVRSEKLREYLSRTYQVILLDSRGLLGQSGALLLGSKQTRRVFITYCVKKLLHRLALTSYPLIEAMRLRGQLLIARLKHMKFDCLICGVEEDMMVLHQDFGKRLTIYDLPTPYAAEVKYSGRYPKSVIKRLEVIEKQTLKKADYFCANWNTYTRYLADHYGVHNQILAPSGCESVTGYARVNPAPKIVFVGNLDGYWVNLKLLHRLSRNSPYPIEVFGPKSQCGLSGLTYRGYLSDHNRLRDYQFGLVTVSDDPLRRIGFSAKHLLYLSYGLPVLSPKWRHDRLLAPATIAYGEHNFNAVVAKYSQKEAWEKKHRAALKLAKQLSWQKTLKPLVSLIERQLG